MSCETDTAVILRGAGQKATLQRVLILSALRHSSGHMTAGEIVEYVRRFHAHIDPSTVYRTLSSAVALGFVIETEMGFRDSEFEWVGADRHHHLVCLSCGNVMELDEGYMAGLATALYEDLGFEADLGRFTAPGTCRECREGRST